MLRWAWGLVRYRTSSDEISALIASIVHLHGSYGRLTQEGARMVAPRKLLLMALSSLGLCGCAASWQDLHYAAVNKTRAEYAWYSSTSFGDRWNCGSDYACGYKSGYYDAATGKGCTLPPVPPPCYWSTKYQCCEGQKHIQDWYRGYQCGVAAAQGSGYPYFHDVPVGPQAPVINKDGCGGCYSPTGCLCEDVATPAVPAESDVPAIPHLSSSETAVAALPAQPVYQASAVSGSVSQIDMGLGLIGPTGPAELKTKNTNLVRPVSTASPAGLIGPVGPAEAKSKVGNERTRVADANASATQPITR